MNNLKFFGIALLLCCFFGFKPQPLQAQTSPHLNPNRGLKDYFADYFKVGVAAGNSNIANDDESKLIKKEFNSFTADNAMKWRYIHPRYSEENSDADYDFTKMDALVAYCQANGMAIRGHVLVWHVVDNLPLYPGKQFSWATRKPDSTLLSRAEFFKRMKAHITKIMTRYKGKIAYYDVVNEAVSDDAATQGALIKSYSDMYKIAAMGGNPGQSFIDSAFKYARQADPTAKLFYNDNNYEVPDKRARIRTLVQNLQARNIPIDGIGMQSHFYSDYPTPQELENTILAFSDLNIKIHITELDVSVYEKNNKTKPADLSYNAQREAIQIANYVNHFRLFRQYKSLIESVTFWNVSDNYTWRTNYPVTGRTDYPLLFDTNYQRKNVYKSVINDMVWENNNYPPKPFVVLIDLSKGTNNTSFTFNPIILNGGVNYSWTGTGGTSGSGTITTSGQYTISGLPASGIVELSIDANLQSLSFYSASHTDNVKVIDVKQWGDVAWTTMANAFRGCVNLANITAADTPNLLWVTDMSNLFYGATNLNGPTNIGQWDVSGVKTMANMFKAADNTAGNAMRFNQDIGNWNIANVNNLSSMFYNCRSFNQDISSWNTASATNLSYMFAYATEFNQPVGNWNIAAATNLQYMFYSASAFNTPLGNWQLNSAITGSNLSHLISNTAINCANYSGTLNAWVNRGNLPKNISFTASGRKYGSNALTARNQLAASVASGGFGWTISDGGVNDGTCDNTAPVANSDTYTISNNVGTTIIKVQDNDTDADGDVLGVVDFNQPANGGTVSLLSGILSFTPAANYVGTVNFGYTVADGKGGTATATVTIQIDDGTLPVTLTAYSATATANGVALNWKTAAELNNNRYEVEKSTDGKAFVKLAVTLPSASFAYTLLDKAPAQGTNYYSLYQYDNNGTKNYLGTKSVNYKFAAATQALVYPNPVTSLINVDLSAYQGTKVTITVADITGKTLYSQTVSGVVGKHTLQYKPKEGAYIVRVVGSGLKTQVKIIVL